MDRLSNRRRFLKRGALFVPAAFDILRAQNIMPGPIMRTITSTGASYLLSENFEGAGTPSGWTDRAPVDYDYDGGTNFGAPFSGQCLHPGNDGGTTSVTFTAATECWFYCLFRMAAYSTGELENIRLRNVSNANVCQLIMYWETPSTVRPYIRHGTINSSVIASTLSVDTTYQFLMYYKNDGHASIEFATDTGEFSGSGNYYTSMTNGDATTAVTEFFIYRAAWDFYIDKIRVDDVAIGGNPT